MTLTSFPETNEAASSPYKMSLHFTADSMSLTYIRKNNRPRMEQYIDNVWQPLSFFSKKLSPAETRYSAFDRELLAVYATIRHFRHNLEGRNFFVNTDHKPLTYVMISVTVRLSLRQTRHLAFIAEFTKDIIYVKGETNFVADAL